MRRLLFLLITVCKNFIKKVIGINTYNVIIICRLIHMKQQGDCDSTTESQLPCYFIYASNEPKSVLARDLGVAKRQWRLFSNDRNGV